jgi:hypothetical protein
MPEGVCRNRECRQPVVVSPRYRNTKYCISCTIDREIADRKKKLDKIRNSKANAIERRNERRARRKLKRQTLGDYPTAGFLSKRKTMLLSAMYCGVTGITNAEHLKLFGRSLHLDHIIPARIAKKNGVDPHDERNLMWLAHSIHAQKKEAEEQLKGKGGNYGFVQVLRKNHWPTEQLITALKYCKMYSENLPL